MRLLHVGLRRLCAGAAALGRQCMRQSPAWLALGTSYGVKQRLAPGAGGPLPEVSPPQPAAPDQQTWPARASLPRPRLLRGRRRPLATESRGCSSESWLGWTQAAVVALVA